MTAVPWRGGRIVHTVTVTWLPNEKWYDDEALNCNWFYLSSYSNKLPHKVELDSFDRFDYFTVHIFLILWNVLWWSIQPIETCFNANLAASSNKRRSNKKTTSIIRWGGTTKKHQQLPTTRLIFLWHEICGMRAKRSIRFYFDFEYIQMYIDMYGMFVCLRIQRWKPFVVVESVAEKAPRTEFLYYSIFFLLSYFCGVSFCWFYGRNNIFPTHFRMASKMADQTLQIAHTSSFLFD